MLQVGEARQVPAARLVPAHVGEDLGAAAGGRGDPLLGAAGGEGGDGVAAHGAQSGKGPGSAGGGASWPWDTMVRSPSYAMETVTGECQPGTVRDMSRSMPSPSASASQQYSP